jgi:lipid A 3-O-deacylase
VAILLVLLDAVPTDVAGQVSAVDVVLENDALMFFLGRGRSDREYTSGLAVGVERLDAPIWGALFPARRGCDPSRRVDQSCLQTRLELGQKIFTPNIEDAVPAPAERPYAGWLYASVTGRVVDVRRALSVRVEAGVTGPPSLAEPFQESIHRWTGFPRPRGWDDQLRFEPGILLRAEDRRRFGGSGQDGTARSDAILVTGATAGNVRTALDAALTLRRGARLPHPWLPGNGEQGEPLHGFVRIQREWVFRDLFLDGNTFDEGPKVERIPFTGHIEVGTVFTRGRYRISSSVVRENRRYRTQPGPHRYVVLTLTVSPEGD